MNNRPIGIFDSGVGGLTVVNAVLEQLPDEDIIYYGDTARFPYGTKDLNEVRGYVFEIAQYMLDLGVKIIVIACNTGTAAGLVDAQKKFSIPIIGVVEPGAHGAALATVNRRVGVIGTKGTIDSGIYQRAIEGLDAGIKVTAQACPSFVEYAERGEISGPAITAVAEAYLDPLKKNGVDTVILGCTHYPLLTGVIQEVMGPDVTLISSATETAREIEENLVRRGFLKEKKDQATHRFMVSGDTKSVKDLIKRFLGRNGETVEQVVI